MMAQVKQGTENRGAIESVVRVVRKTVRDFIIRKRLYKLLMTLLAPNSGTTITVGTEQ
jgi:hypothetical protein